MVEGMSRREAARVFGIHRDTIRKMLEYALPPGYRRKQPAISPKLGPFRGVIDQILKADQAVHRKQRHTAQRIWQRLVAEHGFDGGYTIVREYVRGVKRRSREVFVPLTHRPGAAQVDFGEADAYVNGHKTRIHYFCLDLPHSDAIFVKAYPAETAEAFCDGHNAAFAFFGGVPPKILYDNTKLAVARIRRSGRRDRSRMFSELQSHYLFEDRYGRPGKGNDKGKVESLVKYARRQFLVPLPVVRDLDELNARLLDSCTKRQGARLRGQTETIRERLARDRAALLPLPGSVYDSCHKQSCRVSSLSLVRYKTNDYSVPTAGAHQTVIVKGYVQTVVICAGAEVIARHPRSYGRADYVYDPRHYLALLERKPGALDQAAPLEQWILAPVFDRLRRLLEARMGTRGRREYIQVLRLLETFETARVASAIARAIDLGAISFDAVKHLLLAELERRPARLDLARYPHLPLAAVGRTDPRAYRQLLTGATAGGRGA